MRIGIVYPEVREPYNQVFIALSDGVAATNSSGELPMRVLSAETSVDDLLRWVEKEKVTGIVALGNRGLNLAIQLQDFSPDRQHPPVVVGGTFVDGKINELGIHAISMAPSPKQLFKKNLALFPSLTTINVVYEPDDAWLIARAHTAAKELNISLNAVVANDIRELAAAYQRILKEQKSKEEALWLPYSGKSLEKALMNEVLEMAWRRDLSVFSSNLADVKKGILFSLYPDNEQTGKRLAELLHSRNVPTNDKQNTVLLAEELFPALNTRTAEHLGLRLSSEDLSQYKILFPLKR